MSRRAIVVAASRWDAARRAFYGARTRARRREPARRREERSRYEDTVCESVYGRRGAARSMFVNGEPRRACAQRVIYEARANQRAAYAMRSNMGHMRSAVGQIWRLKTMNKRYKCAAWVVGNVSSENSVKGSMRVSIRRI